jgi:uncharacterized protein involved in exopolysaccharide biosynthesis
VTVLEISRAVGVFRTHWKWLLGLPVLLCALVLLLYTLQAPTYRATAQVILDSRGIERLIDTPRDSNPTPTTVVTTDMDVIRSETVLRRMIAALALDARPTGSTLPAENADQVGARAIAAERRRAWQKETKGEVDFVQYLLSRWLAKALTVQPAAMNSNVVAIQVDYRDAQQASVLANAIANAYLEVALDLELAPTQQTARFFNQQIPAALQTLKTAQAERSQYQRDHGLVSVSEGADLESALMIEMASAATQARAHGAEAASRGGTASANPSDSPEVVQSLVVQQLTSELARQQAAMAELSSRLGPSHPQLQAQQQQIDELQRRLRDESAHIAHSVQLASRSAAGSDRAVQGLLRGQRDRVMALKEAREHLAVLQQNVDSAQRAYEQTMQRLTTANERNASRLSDARLLTAASAPIDPSRPPLLLALLFALSSGLLLGTGGAFVAEQRRPIMRVDTDLIDVLGLPILASMPRIALQAPAEQGWSGRVRFGLRRSLS